MASSMIYKAYDVHVLGIFSIMFFYGCLSEIHGVLSTF
jgi:hypothetical protein